MYKSSQNDTINCYFNVLLAAPFILPLMKFHIFMKHYFITSFFCFFLKKKSRVRPNFRVGQVTDFITFFFLFFFFLKKKSRVRPNFRVGQVTDFITSFFLFF